MKTFQIIFLFKKKSVVFPLFKKINFKIILTLIKNKKYLILIKITKIILIIMFRSLNNNKILTNLMFLLKKMINKMNIKMNKTPFKIIIKIYLNNCKKLLLKINIIFKILNNYKNLLINKYFKIKIKILIILDKIINIYILKVKLL
jgi:hypothetical protein